MARGRSAQKTRTRKKTGVVHSVLTGDRGYRENASQREREHKPGATQAYVPFSGQHLGTVLKKVAGGRMTRTRAVQEGENRCPGSAVELSALLKGSDAAGKEGEQETGHPGESTGHPPERT